MDWLLVALYASSIVGTIFSNSTIPLFYEMAVESVYPIAEGLTTSTLTTMNNLGCLLFLLVQNIPRVGTRWMNWAMTGACVAGLVAIVPLAEDRRRLAVDLGAAPTAEAAAAADEDGGPGPLRAAPINRAAREIA